MIEPAEAEAQQHAPRTAGVHVVLLVHGINTRAKWIHIVGPTLDEAGFRAASAGYGVFGVLRFLLPFEFVRRSAVERVRKQLRIAIEVHKPDKLSVIAHSFGSFIVARLLLSEFDVQWHRIIFCGSVNNSEFEVEQVLRRFTLPMLNDVGGRDYLPALAEKATRTFGSVGSYGFLNAAVRDRFHRDKDHSGFLTREFCTKWWVPFLSAGIIERGDEWQDFPLLVRILLRVPWRFILLGATIVLIYYGALLARWAIVEEIPYRYSQSVSVARPYVDLGAAISATVSDIEANCRRGPVDRWLRQQQCIPTQMSSEIAALRACKDFDVRVSTPEAGLRSLTARFGDCFSLRDDVTSLSVSIRPDAVTRLTDRQGTWFMCGCNPEQMRSLESLPR